MAAMIEENAAIVHLVSSVECLMAFSRRFSSDGVRKASSVSPEDVEAEETALHAAYQAILQKDESAGEDLSVSILQLRALVLKKGLPRTAGRIDNIIRTQVWKLLLGVTSACSSSAYQSKLEV